MRIQADTPIQYLKGVGPKLGALFSKRGIHTIGDLLEWYPRAYEDRRAARSISTLSIGDLVSIKAKILGVTSIPMGRTQKKIWSICIGDDSGRIYCKYFRVPYKGYFERFETGHIVRVVGKVIEYRGQKEFHHPDIKDIEPNEEETDRLVPIYTETEGLSTHKVSTLIKSVIASLNAELIHERLPRWIKEKYQLPDRHIALRYLHDPPNDQIKEFMELRSSFHRRIIFEEFFWLELFLASRKSGIQKDRAPIVKPDFTLADQLTQSLPFELTNAQKKAIKEIVDDLQKPHPMHRLVQGDVGSGKTLVALMVCLIAKQSALQSTIMVPTEILAEQHYNNSKKLLEPLGVRVGLLTGKMKAKEKKEVLAGLASGEINLCIGTHALIQDEVNFANLGLAIIDEQHRFGVEQRKFLKQKGESPHFLVMTATPIPRSLAMTVYGDLDVSIINELPKGRSPIQTRVIYENKRSLMFDFLREQIKVGRQGYMVYPLVEESEKIDLKDAITEYENLQRIFPEFKIGLLHGRMSSEEKDEIMNHFRRNEIQILVSTTVIEVGVDVPNANIMVVEHAERFGLSQLHQLRGRVGRGEHKSFCILVLGHAVSQESFERTRIMEQTCDGFKIAEADLEIRGPGEFLGTRQSGLTGFKMANLVRDVVILQDARQAAFEVLRRDKELKNSENALLRNELLRQRGPTALASVG